MWYMHILPSMECELQSPEVLAAALQPIIYMINESSAQEFQEFILPFIKNIFQMPKSVQVGAIAFCHTGCQSTLMAAIRALSGQLALLTPLNEWLTVLASTTVRLSNLVLAVPPTSMLLLYFSVSAQWLSGGSP